MPSTSLRIYERIRKEGLLRGLRLAIYRVLQRDGAHTAGELWSEHFPKRQRSSISSRMSELEECGAVSKAGERDCRLTGNRAIAWNVSGRVPMKRKMPTRRKCCPECKGRGWVIPRRKPEDTSTLLLFADAR